MSQEWIIYLAGVSALFAARAFLPALLAGLALRFPQHLPFLDVQVSGELGQWITSDAGLTILAILAALEILAVKNPHVQEVMEQLDGWVKMGVAALVNYSVIQTEQGRLIFGVQEATPLVLGVALASAAPVAGFTRVRRSALRFLRDIDPDNDLGLISVTSWLEDLWVFLAVMFLVVVPVVALTLILLGMAGVAAFDLWVRVREEKRKVPCPTCGTRAHPFALRCPSCSTELERPVGVGALGQPSHGQVMDRALHEMRLLSVRRCPHCGERLMERKLPQPCPACHQMAGGHGDDVHRYVHSMEERLSHALMVTFLVGLIPLLGGAFSVVYTRVVLVRPYRQYLSRRRSFMLKWLVRFAIFVLLVLSVIPMMGLLVCPLIALVSHHSWRGGFRRKYGLAA